VDIDTSYKALKNGKLGGDNIWRQIVTLEDAVKLGFDLVDTDEIRNENSPMNTPTCTAACSLKPGTRLRLQRNSGLRR
jgi:hypothetical protein